MPWKTCQNCHGNGKIKRQLPNGTWREETCTACNGKGKINTGLI